MIEELKKSEDKQSSLEELFKKIQKEVNQAVRGNFRLKETIFKKRIDGSYILISKFGNKKYILDIKAVFKESIEYLNITINLADKKGNILDTQSFSDIDLISEHLIKFLEEQK